ncbi:unnamed protein product [Musa acuminata subsp. burmannicoides]
MESHEEYGLKEFNPIDCKLGQAVAIATGAMKLTDDLAPSKNLNFARDRLVECYFWILGVFFELYYSRARVIMTKVITLISILDDIYDVYSTLEESQQLAKTIQRFI